MSSGLRRVMIMWHKHVLWRKIERHKEEHHRARIAHAATAAAQIVSKIRLKIIASTWKVWRKGIEWDAETERRISLGVVKCGMVLKRARFAALAGAYHKLSRHAHLTAHDHTRLAHGFRTCLAVLKKRELRLVGGGFRQWMRALHADLTQDERVASAKRKIIRELISNVQQKIQWGFSTWRRCTTRIRVAQLRASGQRDVEKLKEQHAEETARLHAHALALDKAAAVADTERKMIAVLRRLQNAASEQLAMGWRAWRNSVEQDRIRVTNAARGLRWLGNLWVRFEQRVVSKAWLRWKDTFARDQMRRIQSERSAEVTRLRRQSAVDLEAVEKAKQEALTRLRRQSAVDLAAVQKAKQEALRQNGVARLMKRALMSNDALLRSCLHAWHVQSVHIAPVQRTAFQQTIGHGASRANSVVRVWAMRRLARGFRQWQSVLWADAAAANAKSTGAARAIRLLRRRALREMGRGFRTWQKTANLLREIERGAWHADEVATLRRGSVVLSARGAAVTVVSTARRLQKAQLWRAWNKWTLVCQKYRETQRRQHAEAIRERATATQMNILHSDMRLAFVRDGCHRLHHVLVASRSKVHVARAFTRWAFHSLYGIPLHVRSRRREAGCKIVQWLERHGIAGPASPANTRPLAGALARTQKRAAFWCLVGHAHRVGHRQHHACHRMRHVCQGVLRRRLARAWRKWHSESHKLAFRVGAHKALARTLGRVVGLSLRKRRILRAWRKWRDVTHNEVLNGVQLGTQRVLRTWRRRDLQGAWRSWLVLVDTVRQMQRKRAAGAETVSTVLLRVIHVSAPRRKTRRALALWRRACWRSREEEAVLEHRQQLQTCLLGGLVRRRQDALKLQMAKTVWSWRLSATESERAKLAQSVAKKRLHCTRLESAVTVYKSQQVSIVSWVLFFLSLLAWPPCTPCSHVSYNAHTLTHARTCATYIITTVCQVRDAATRARFETEVLQLKGRFGRMQVANEVERASRAAEERRAALGRCFRRRRMALAWRADRRVAVCWSRWVGIVGRTGMRDLQKELVRRREQSKKAAGRIASLVERAQEERAETVRLLATMKVRTTAMEEEVVQHLAGGDGIHNSNPEDGIEAMLAGSPSFGMSARVSQLLTEGQKQAQQQQHRRLVGGGGGATRHLAGSNAKKRRPRKGRGQKRSPVASRSPRADPYNLIVEQILTAVRSKSRTLFGRPVDSLLSLFQAIDDNSDGNISDDEFRDAMRRLDVNITDKQMSHLLTQMRNVEGHQGRVSYGAFVASMQSHHEELQEIMAGGGEKGATSIRRGSYFGTYKVEN